jgi:hypothetical protein
VPRDKKKRKKPSWGAGRVFLFVGIGVAVLAVAGGVAVFLMMRTGFRALTFRCPPRHQSN